MRLFHKKQLPNTKTYKVFIFKNDTNGTWWADIETENGRKIGSFGPYQRRNNCVNSIRQLTELKNTIRLDNC